MLNHYHDFTIFVLQQQFGITYIRGLKVGGRLCFTRAWIETRCFSRLFAFSWGTSLNRREMLLALLVVFPSCARGAGTAMSMAWAEMVSWFAIGPDRHALDSKKALHRIDY